MAPKAKALRKLHRDQLIARELDARHGGPAPHDTAPASPPDRAALSREWNSLTPAAQAAIAALGNGRIEAVASLLESGEPLPMWFRRMLAAMLRDNGPTDYALVIRQRRRAGAPPPAWLDLRGILIGAELEQRAIAGEPRKRALHAVAEKWRVSESTAKSADRFYRELSSSATAAEYIIRRGKKPRQ